MNRKVSPVNQLGLDFDVCKNNHQGNAESVGAYEAGKPTRESKLKNILSFITDRGLHGATADEAAEALGIFVQTASACCSELRARGHVFRHGLRKTSRGNSAAVLVAREFINLVKD